MIRLMRMIRNKYNATIPRTPCEKGVALPILMKPNKEQTRRLFMKTLHTSLLFLLCLIAPLSAMANSLSAADAAKVQQAWKLLDYVATDYTGAVAAEGGKIISQAEYDEQVEFSKAVVKVLNELPANDALPKLKKQGQALIKAVNNKVPPAEIDTRAHTLAKELLEAYPVPSAPTETPDLQQGAKLYSSTCAACHGATGNGQGPAAAGLNPPPIDFTDAHRADMRSPLSLYQAMTQGIAGTSMVSYKDTFTSEQRWALAYFVGSFAYADKAAAGKKIWENNEAIRARISNLEELSHTRAAQLEPAFGQDTARAVVGYLRSHPEAVAAAPKGLELARMKLAASLSAYKAGRSEEAVQLALASYLEGVEPVEPLLDARNHNLRTQIETAMGAYRTTLADNAELAEVKQAAQSADALLKQAHELLTHSAASPSTAFIGAFTILVREGLEALLVVVALLAFLLKAERKEAARYVHYGWILALLAGGLTWGVATYLVSISGASRELTEGFSALFAAVVLIAVGLWMHQKSIGGRWQEYLKQKMNAALTRRTGWFLFILSFVSVYREVFETILFYVALWSDGQHAWMLAGMGAAVVVLAIIAWVLLRTSRRLPLSQFFTASSALIALLAFVMVGKGVAALQEAGVVGVSLVSAPRINWLGIFPTSETLIAQGIVVVLLVAGVVYNYSKSKAAKAS